jgi:hypothetical protein
MVSHDGGLKQPHLDGAGSPVSSRAVLELNPNAGFDLILDISLIHTRWQHDVSNVKKLIDLSGRVRDEEAEASTLPAIHFDYALHQCALFRCLRFMITRMCRKTSLASWSVGGEPMMCVSSSVTMKCTH